MLHIIIIISDLVPKLSLPKYCIEVLLNLTRYQQSLGNEIINTKRIYIKSINM